MEYTVDMLRTGERKVFEGLFRELSPRLYEFAAHYAMNGEVAKDVVQDAFLHLLEALPTLPGETRVDAYLYASVKNGCANYFKRLQVEDAHREKLAESLIFSGTTEYEDDSELMAKVRECVEMLPEQQRRVLEMKVLRNMTYREIARELDVTELTVHTHVKRAYKFIRESVPEDLLRVVGPLLAWHCFF